MSKEGGLMVIPTTPQSTKQHHVKQALDASVLDRLSKMKISDENQNDQASSVKDRTRNLSSTMSSASSGIGSGELSPTQSGSVGSKSSTAFLESENGEEKCEKTEEKRRMSMANSTEIDKISRDDTDDKHARSLTISNCAIGKKSAGQPQKGGHLSPAEFFQMSRLRASALANKMNTAATFGGSKDLVTNALVNVGQREQKKEENEQVKADQAVDELTKGVGQVKLDKSDENDENKEKSDSVDDGELIGRSPVPVYSNNRHVQHPYKQSGAKYPAPETAPSPGYCPPKNADGQPLSPAEYLQQQRVRATAGQSHYPQQMNRQQYIVPPQQQNGYTMYQQPHGQMDERQAQITPPSCYQQPMDQSGVYSPNNYGNQHSPCAMQQQRFTDATPPASVSAWVNNDQNIQMGNSSPAQHSDDGQGNYPMVVSPFEDTVAAELYQKIQSQAGNNDRHMSNKNMEELPEALSDFILKYSRRYSTSSSVTVSSGRSAYGDGNRSGMSSGCVSGEPSPMSTGARRPSDSSLSGISGDESGVEDDHMSSISSQSINGGRPESCHSSAFLDSPQSVCGSVPPTASPSAPMPSQLTKMEEKTACKYRPLRPKQPQQAQQPQPAAQPTAGQQQQIGSGKARQRLREMIPQHEFDAAWAWAMRCWQACPGALLFRDIDGDSLLHIVVWHKDLAKIYAVTEILMKDDTPTATKPFDLPNKMEETPLFLSVEKRCADVVAYLLECGANPNLRARNHDGDGPLHYAAARGMSEIVQLFCSSSKTNFNLLNGSGMTPLLCAVKNHGVIEEESQCLVNNKPTIRTLLKAGADPKIPDVASGKSVLHYCVERMDPDLVELFRDHLSKDAMSQLVNMPDYNGDTPLHILTRMVGGSAPRSSSFARAEGEEELRRKMLNTLIDCGADVSQCAGGLGDHCGNNGSIVILYPGAEQDSAEDIQFTILDSPESY